MAIRWLDYMEPTEETGFDPVKEFSLRRPIHDALTGKPAGVGSGGFILRCKRWLPWRRRPPRSLGMRYHKGCDEDRGRILSHLASPGHFFRPELPTVYRDVWPLHHEIALLTMFCIGGDNHRCVCVVTP